MMDDLRTKLRQTSVSFGEPGYTLRGLEGLKKRRERRSRSVAMAVALVIVALAGSLLFDAFRGGSTDTRVGEGPRVQNGRISFIVGEFGGRMEGIRLASANPDGSDRRTLIDGVAEYLTGGWSPDGSTLVFSRDPIETPDGDASIWTMGADGSHLKQLTDGHVDHDAQWSPDATRILFLRSSPDGELRCDGHLCRDAAPAIFVMNADGSGVRRLSDDPKLIVLGARWSPDGQQIVFIADTWADDGREGLGIYVVRSDGTDPRRIVPGVNGAPQWSPSGERILFQLGSRLVTVDGTGSDLQPLVEGLHRDVHFRWSPEGDRLLFVRPVSPEVGTELWVAAADGSGERLVAERLQWPDAGAAWSPDGRLIAFARDGDIWTVDVESGAEHQVTDTPAYESIPAWGAGDAS
jgi:Tol biopolymer transport system component